MTSEAELNAQFQKQKEEKVLNKMYNEMETELKEDILSFWSKKAADKENGGFFGYISRDMKADANADKSSVIYARILWAFSRSYRRYKEKTYLDMAERAYNCIINWFCDKENGGVFWLTDYRGVPNNLKKQVYAQAFTLYALAEYYDITRNDDVLKLAYEFFEILEKKCRDSAFGGYYDAFSKEWGELNDTSLSERDLSCAKTMNTNLHVMEAYTNFCRVTKDSRVREALCDIIDICMTKVYDRDRKCFNLYFDREWNPITDNNSFGHDIEGSWLLCEAADETENKELVKKAYSIAADMAENVFKYGVNPKGGMFEESRNGEIITDSTQWWVFAEAVIGFFNAYQITKDKRFLNESKNQWEYIKNKIIDKKNGEWFWGITNDGEKTLGDEKVSSWKCPYHNSRMCIEIIERIEKAEV